MAGTIVEPTKTNHGEITLDLSAATGPAGEERQGGDQEDRRTGRQTERGKGRAGGDSGRDVPSRRISPLRMEHGASKKRNTLWKSASILNSLLSSLLVLISNFHEATFS